MSQRFNGVNAVLVCALLSLLLFPGEVQSQDAVKINNVELVPEGQSRLTGGIRLEQSRTLADLGNDKLRYDNNRFKVINYRMGVLDNFEVRLGAFHSDNNPITSNSPGESGLEGIEIGSKIQWHPNISTSFSGKFNGTHGLYPYGANEPSYSINMPLKFTLGDGVFHGEVGYTFQSGEAELPVSHQVSWSNYGNIGLGYAYQVNRFTDMSLEVVGHGATAKAVTAGGTTTDTGTNSPSLDFQDSLELILGTNVRLARGVQLEPSIGFALMDGSPDFSFGLTYSILFGGHELPDQQRRMPLIERFSGREPVGGIAEDEAKMDTATKRKRPKQDSQLEALLRKGYQAAQNGNLSRAIRLYTQAKELDPNNLLVLSNLGSLHYRQGDYRRAVENYRKAVQVDSRDVFSLLYLGASHYQLGNTNSARNYFQRVLEIDPDNQRAQQWLREMG